MTIPFPPNVSSSLPEPKPSYLQLKDLIKQAISPTSRQYRCRHSHIIWLSRAEEPSASNLPSCSNVSASKSSSWNAAPTSSIPKIANWPTCSANYSPNRVFTLKPMPKLNEYKGRETVNALPSNVESGI